MPRQRSERVEAIKQRLKTRLTEGVHRPGDRFPSTRELAAAAGISYQTAHRLISELEAEGLLERRHASGTYIPGGKVFWDGAHLIFSERAHREGSFGARLLEKLTRRLERDGVIYKVSLDHEIRPRRGYFPVIWEVPSVVEACLRAQRPALLLNDRPQPGLSATYLDSVSIDDFSGGAGAAQLLLRAAGEAAHHLAVLAGPEGDARSVARVSGFLSVLRGAEVIHSGSWYFEDGYRAAERAIRAGAEGIFCANDRLADAVRSWCADQGRPAPPLVGFDDAPVAEKIGLTTMAIPWDEFIAGAAELIKRRVGGDAGGSRQLILTPRPIVRS